MKKIWGFLKHHIREDFTVKYYLSIAIFLTVTISLNYAFNFEDDYLEVMSGYPKFIAYLLFFSFPYFGAVYILSKSKELKVFSNTSFWVKSLFAITLLSLDNSMPFLDDIISKMVAPQISFWTYKVMVNSLSFFTIFIPILIFYIFYERKENHLYGLAPHKFDARPYFIMLLIMLPLIITVSYNPSFLRQYPMYKTSSAHEYLGVPEWLTVAGYELAYGLDFITVEYLFRGFLVIAMISVLGRGAVLSMAVVYCVLHFGKPAGEAVSSIVGGYILGVIAYETKSIWGGIIVHMGIAWMMELISFIQKHS